MLKVITSPRSEISALSYKAEHAAASEGVSVPAKSEDARHYLEEIEEIRARQVLYSWTVRGEGETGDGTDSQEAESTVGELIARMLTLQEAKAAKQSELGAAQRPLTDATKALAGWLDRNLGNLNLILANADENVKAEIATKVAEVGVAQYLDTSTTRLQPESWATDRSGSCSSLSIPATL